MHCCWNLSGKPQLHESLVLLCFVHDALGVCIGVDRALTDLRKTVPAGFEAQWMKLITVKRCLSQSNTAIAEPDPSFHTKYFHHNALDTTSTNGHKT
jgi:hypothetical protein